MKSRIIAALAVIVAVFVNLEALLRHWGVEAAATAQLNSWGIGEAAYRGHVVALVLVALACVLLGRIIAGCWSIVIDVALVAVFAGLTTSGNLLALVMGAIIGAEGASCLRRDYGMNRLWSRILMVAVFISVYAGTCATVPINKISIAIIGAAAIVFAGGLQHLFTLEVSPDKKYPSEIE
jgi:hypothetical protein